MKTNDFNTYPHYVYATIYFANGIPLDWKIGNEKKTWWTRTFRNCYLWEKYVFANHKKLNLECKYIEMLVNNDEEHNIAFKILEKRIKCGMYD